MKRSAIDLYRKSAEDYLHVLQCNSTNINPQVLWNLATFGKYPITTSNTPRGYTSEIEFFGEKLIVTDLSEVESKQKVAIVAANQLLGLRLPHWEVVNSGKWKKTRTTTADQLQTFEKARYAAIKVCFNRAREIMISSKTTMQNVTPDEFWETVTHEKHEIETDLTPNGFISTIDFIDQTIHVEDRCGGSRMKVAAIALDKLLDIRLPHWSHYLNSNTSNVSIMNRASSASGSVDTLEPLEKPGKGNQTERVEIMDYFSKRAQRLTSNQNKQNRVNPIDLWYSITESRHPINMTTTNNICHCQIFYYGKNFDACDTSENRSRCKVSVKALNALFGIYYDYWSQYSTPTKVPTSTASGTEQNASKKTISAVNSGNARNDRETKIKQIEEKVRVCQRSYPNPTPSFFWHQVAGDMIVKSETRNGRTDSSIDFFGHTFSAGHQNRKASRHMVAAIALCDLFDVNYPHWKEFNPFGKVTGVATSGTTDKNAKSEETVVLSDDDVPLPSDDDFIPPPIEKLSPEEVEAIVAKLKCIAREIIDQQEDIDPTELWNQTVKEHSRYMIKTEYHSKLDKYIATIEFYNQVFTKMDVEEMKAENMVACAALDELIKLAFEEEGTGTENDTHPQLEEPKEVNKKQGTAKEVKIKTPEPITPETEGPKEVKVSVAEDEENIRTSIETCEPKPTDEEPTRPNSSTQRKHPGLFYEPLPKRVETVLKNVATHHITSSYLIFKHSNVPSLTENEWNVLKEINANVFSVNIDESLADTKIIFKSVIVNDHQLFGKGLTDTEATHATIVMAFEYIEKEGLEIGIDAIEISKRSVEESDSDDGSLDDEGPDNEEPEEISHSTRIQGLKKSLKSMQEKSKNLDNVPCSEIFENIGIDFKFEFDCGEGVNDPTLARIKDRIGRFAVMKLLDLAYDLDN